MTGKILSWAAAAGLLAGACLLVLALPTGPGSSGKGNGEGDGAGPQIVLRGVEMVEARREGQVYRLVSENALYSVLSERASATEVTLVLNQKEGDIVVTAPVASWDMKEGRIELARGASARSEGGWTAVSPAASVDLKEEVIRAQEARLSGPGLTVVGNELRWSLRNGRVELVSPRSTILPGRDLAPGRKG